MDVELHKELMNKFKLAAVNLQSPDMLICRIKPRNRNDLSDNLSNLSLAAPTVRGSKKKYRLRGGVDIEECGFRFGGSAAEDLQISDLQSVRRQTSPSLRCTHVLHDNSFTC